jgi:hypothetical protein
MLKKIKDKIVYKAGELVEIFQRPAQDRYFRQVERTIPVIEGQIRTALVTGDKAKFCDLAKRCYGELIDGAFKNVRENLVDAGDTATLGKMLDWEHSVETMRYIIAREHALKYAMNTGAVAVVGYMLDNHPYREETVWRHMEQLYERGQNEWDGQKALRDLLRSKGFDIESIPVEVEAVKKRRAEFQPVPWKERRDKP